MPRLTKTSMLALQGQRNQVHLQAEVCRGRLLLLVSQVCSTAGAPAFTNSSRHGAVHDVVADITCPRQCNGGGAWLLHSTSASAAVHEPAGCTSRQTARRQSGQPATPSLLCPWEHPPAASESLPCADVKASADPELHWCDKGPLDELIDWEPKDHEAEELLADRHHWQDHGKQEDRGGQQHAPAQQVAPVCQLCLALLRTQNPAKGQASSICTAQVSAAGRLCPPLLGSLCITCLEQVKAAPKAAAVTSY